VAVIFGAADVGVVANVGVTTDSGTAVALQRGRRIRASSR